MKRFRLDRPDSLQAAALALEPGEGADRPVLKAGGVDLLDRLKERVAEPEVVVSLVDVKGRAREIHAEGGRVHVGALVTLAELAVAENVKGAAPSVGEAAGQAASPQIRNLATVGGNLAQRNRCHYYRFRSFACFRRGATACSTRRDGAVQDMAGVFANDPCASAHPSSLAPALCALDATLHWTLPDGKDVSAPLRSLWHVERVRGREEDLALPPGAVLTGVSFAALDVGRGEVDAYREIRPRGAFDWALASCGVRLRREGTKVALADVWLGAVAPVPWRAEAAERALKGQTFTSKLAAVAAEAATAGAAPLEGTRYKVPMIRAAVRRTLEEAWGRS